MEETVYKVRKACDSEDLAPFEKARIISSEMNWLVALLFDPEFRTPYEKHSKEDEFFLTAPVLFILKTQALEDNLK
jgi:hypothetical protein